MIPGAFIDEWQIHSPWRLRDQVEQDLIVSRAIIEIYANEVLTFTFLTLR